MSTTDIKLDKLSQILSDFIEKQTRFNEEQRKFNEEQREFNERIDKKIDKVQYFLEETIAENAKIFFDEQEQMKNHMELLENDVSELKQDMFNLSSHVKILQGVVST